MHACQPERRSRLSSALTAVRRSNGPTADEIHVLCRPADGTGSPAVQAEQVYGALVEALEAEGVGPDAVVTETVFCRRVRDDAPIVRAARSRELGRAGRAAYRPATTFVGQPPLADGAHLELAAVALVPRGASAWSARDVGRVVACRCAGCAAGMRARVLTLGDRTAVYAGNVYGSGRDAFAQAYDMFRVGETLLAEAGLRFTDVVRTWIHLRDIDRDYDALNAARREFFHHAGIEPRPASTGVQGIPATDAHDFSLSLHAINSGRPLEITTMSTPSLNEAWTYGADFSRGLRVAEAGRTTLYVSGTASIDEAGRTVHAGDFATQVDRMLSNVESLLAGQGAGFEHVVSGVTYVKHRDDAPALRALFAARGFDGFPCALVEAPLCRPDLLCETEAVAVVPCIPSGA